MHFFFFSCLLFLVRSSCPSAYMLTTSWRTMHVRVRTFFSNSHSAHKYVQFYPTSTPSTEYILSLSLSLTLSNSHSLSLHLSFSLTYSSSPLLKSTQFYIYFDWCIVRSTVILSDSYFSRTDLCFRALSAKCSAKCL